MPKKKCCRLSQAFFMLTQIPYFGMESTARGVITSFSFSLMIQLTIAPSAGIFISDDPLLMAIDGSACLGCGIGQKTPHCQLSSSQN